MRYDLLLKRKKRAIGVWGTGYIGYSTMAYFSKNGVNTIGHDISKERIDTINRGDYIIGDLKTWLNFPVKPLVKKALMKGTIDYMDLAREGVLVHFIAIPTEKDGKPYFSILKNVVKNICEVVKARQDAYKPLVIVESTLSPRSSDTLIIPLFKEYGVILGRDILYGVAPRRDWFVDGGKNLSELDRVFGGYDDESSRRIAEVLGIVCRKLHRASNCYVSEMVKSFENAYRHMEITLANQISLAYPSRNIREALELAGTKWNIGTFRPGFGTGGYCIPLSSKYVIEGAEKRSELTILKETVKTDNKINVLIAESLVRKGLKKIAVLGLSYKGNLKVSALSPAIPFVKTLVKNGADVRIFDPYFSDAEIKKIVNIPTFRFPEGLKIFDAIVLVAGHDKYRLSKKALINNIGRCRYILDNTGFWSAHKNDLNNMGVEYHLAGDPNWL